MKHSLKLPRQDLSSSCLSFRVRGRQRFTLQNPVCRFALTCTFPLTVALSGCDHTAFRSDPLAMLCCQSSVPLGGGCRLTDSHSFHTLCGSLRAQSSPPGEVFLETLLSPALAGRLEKPADSGYSPAMCQTLYPILHILTSVSPLHNL